MLVQRQGGWGDSRSGAAGGGRGGGEGGREAEDEGERLIVTFGANERGQCGQVNYTKKNRSTCVSSSTWQGVGVVEVGVLYWYKRTNTDTFTSKKVQIMTPAAGREWGR